MLKRIFSWWNGHTIGAAFDINKRARPVGQDSYGNRFYEEHKASIEGRKRRYILYKGLAEPSKVSADWHGWLHHTLDLPPTLAPFERRDWETEHQPNLTGTPLATRPKGSLAGGRQRQKTDSDYEAWNPDA